MSIKPGNWEEEILNPLRGILILNPKREERASLSLKLHLKTKIVSYAWMMIHPESLHVSWLYSVFLGQNLGQNATRNCPQHFLNFLQIEHVTHTHCSRVRVVWWFSSPRVHVWHALGSLRELQSMRTCQARVRVAAIFSISRGRVSHASTSVFAGHLLGFLCSFHFCKLPLHSLSHSFLMKPETLNTRIMALNGIKEN